MESITIHEAILRSINDAVYVVDRDMRIQYANPAAVRITGYTMEESLGKKCYEIFCEQSPRCTVGCPLMKAVHDNIPSLRRDAETRTKGGILRMTQISISPSHDAHWGDGAVLIINDITELRQAEEKVILKNKFLTKVIDALPHPFYVIDASNYRLKLANYAACPGSIPKEATCHEFSHQRRKPCRGDQHPCPLKKIRETGQPVMVEHTHRYADGSLKEVEVHGYPLFDDKGNLMQMIEYCIDISDRKQAAKERDLLIQDLQHALGEVKALSGLLPICSSCKKIRDDHGYWNDLEQYISKHSEAEFSHSICPDCAQKLYPDLYRRIKSS
ncbi:MAG TPA: PAS domain S-box protein [Nitrospirota bacterium]|nr:PAS domain S-box protein [Nitrospirota bacterium]